MFRYLFVLVALVHLLSCQSQVESSAAVSERAFWSIPPSEAQVDQWQAPEALGQFTLVGDVANAEQQRRILYYENEEKVALEVKLYPIPGGWEDMPPRRAIGGHQIYQQQQYESRALREGGQAPHWNEETTLEWQSLPHPVLQRTYTHKDPQTTWQQGLWVTLLPPVFVTLHWRGPAAEPVDISQVEQALQTFAEHNRSRWQPTYE